MAAGLPASQFPQPVPGSPGNCCRPQHGGARGWASGYRVRTVVGGARVRQRQGIGRWPGYTADFLKAQNPPKSRLSSLPFIPCLTYVPRHGCMTYVNTFSYFLSSRGVHPGSQPSRRSQTAVCIVHGCMYNPHAFSIGRHPFRLTPLCYSEGLSTDSASFAVFNQCNVLGISHETFVWEKRSSPPTSFPEINAFACGAWLA
jgi:hypothetical protein